MDSLQGVNRAQSTLVIDEEDQVWLSRDSHSEEFKFPLYHCTAVNLGMVLNICYQFAH